MFLQNQFVGRDICLEDTKAQLSFVHRLVMSQRRLTEEECDNNQRCPKKNLVTGVRRHLQTKAGSTTTRRSIMEKKSTVAKIFLQILSKHQNINKTSALFTWSRFCHNFVLLLGVIFTKPSSKFLSIQSGWLSKHFIVHLRYHYQYFIISITSNDIFLKNVSLLFMAYFIHNFEVALKQNICSTISNS